MFRKERIEESTLVRDARKAGNLDKVIEHNLIRDKENQKSWNEGMAIGLGIGWVTCTIGTICGIVLYKKTNDRLK